MGREGLAGCRLEVRWAEPRHVLIGVDFRYDIACIYAFDDAKFHVISLLGVGH